MTTGDALLDLVIASGTRSYEDSVVPGSYRGKFFKEATQQESEKVTAALSRARQHLDDEVEELRQIKLRKRLQHQKASLSFMEMKEGLR